MKNSPTLSFKYLPSVQQVIEQFDDFHIKTGFLAEIIRAALDDTRSQIERGKLSLSSRKQALAIIQEQVNRTVQTLTETPLKRVVNATGVVLHTGLGRAPLGERAFQFLSNLGSGYLNLEFNLENGKRGERLDLTDRYLQLLTGAESSAVVNNNAAAVMIALNSLANRKEVIVSRGELIEIGGSFRLPDVMKKSGAKMVEIGTTNRTHISDYENAITPRTGAILIPHTSNYRVQGFTEKPAESEIVELAHRQGIPVIFDLGSGALIATDTLGLPYEPIVSEVVAAGADIVSFSGDKLLGGSQAGLIVGKSGYINKIRKNPLMRVVRCDKIILSLLVYTLSHYILEDDISRIQTYEFLTRNRDKLQRMAQQIIDNISKSIGQGIELEICDTLTEAGSGSMPTETIPSVALRIHSEKVSEEKLAKLFRQQDPPVIGYLNNGQFYLDLKAVAEKEIPFIENAIVKVASLIK